MNTLINFLKSVEFENSLAAKGLTIEIVVVIAILAIGAVTAGRGNRWVKTTLDWEAKVTMLVTFVAIIASWPLIFHLPEPDPKLPAGIAIFGTAAVFFVDRQTARR